MNTSARLTHAAVRSDQSSDLHVVVSLVAPPAEAGRERPPGCIVPVVDVSGSMSGRTLHEAKQSVVKLVDHRATLSAFGCGPDADNRGGPSDPLAGTGHLHVRLDSARAGIRRTTAVQRPIRGLLSTWPGSRLPTRRTIASYVRPDKG